MEDRKQEEEQGGNDKGKPIEAPPFMTHFLWLGPASRSLITSQF